MSEVPHEEERQLENRYFATEQLTQAGQTIAALADAMPRARGRIDRVRGAHPDQAYDAYCELQKAQVKLVELLAETRLSFAEIGAQPLSELAALLGQHVGEMDLMVPDYSGIEAVLKALAAEMAPEKTVSAANIGRLMNEARVGFYPTDPENVRHIARGIRFPDETRVNLLDPCCGEGAALYTLASGGCCDTYGIELSSARAERAQDLLGRVGFGSFFSSQLSHEVFHAVFLNPPYLSVVGENGRSRDEKRFLVSVLPYLMIGGLLVYIIPYYRMTPDICRLLAAHLKDISIYRFTDEEFHDHRQVAVLGVRCCREENKLVAELLERATYTPGALPSLPELPEGRYALPNQERVVAVFKGAVFNQLELAHQLRESKSFDQLFEKSTLTSRVQRPLLPLSVSQIGLVGGSGLINGLVDCDVPHVVKGRVVKHKTTSHEVFRDSSGHITSEETKETHSNKMKFTLLTPFGAKKLA